MGGREGGGVGGYEGRGISRPYIDHQLGCMSELIAVIAERGVCTLTQVANIRPRHNQGGQVLYRILQTGARAELENT